EDLGLPRAPERPRARRGHEDDQRGRGKRRHRDDGDSCESSHVIGLPPKSLTQQYAARAREPLSRGIRARFVIKRNRTSRSHASAHHRLAFLEVGRQRRHATERAGAAMADDNGLTRRLDEGTVICAEGFLFELERRGYLTAGEFVPEVALENPEALRTLHIDFQRAGSDVVEAFTYNGHREKMRVIGKEDLLEPLNRQALRTAREVADRVPGNLVAGNISNTNTWDPNDAAAQREVRGMFEEMVGWAVEE